MPDPVTIPDVEAELDKINSSGSSPIKNIATLVVTVGLFVLLGLFTISPQFLALLVGVLFIHETGHAIGMKIFGYRDMKMFFIPLFGAAVSGREKNPSGTQRAVVSLLGPAPGIVLGIIAAILSVSLHAPLLLTYAKISVGLNLFNLLPFYPLDGGRFMEAVLFSRSLFLEIVFKLLAALALAACAWLFSSFFFGLLAFFGLFTLREVHLQGKIARLLKMEPLPDTDRIPREQLQRIMPELVAGGPEAGRTPRNLATRASAIWSRARLVPPDFFASLGLLVCYIVVFVAGLLGGATLMWMQRETSVTHVSDASGASVPVQVTTWGGHKIEEAQLNDQGQYDGPCIATRANGGKESKGNYREGFKDGKWDYYDAQGNLSGYAYYEMGNPASYYGLSGATYVQLPREQWPYLIRIRQLNPRLSDEREPRDMHWWLSRLKAKILGVQERKP